MARATKTLFITSICIGWMKRARWKASASTICSPSGSLVLLEWAERFPALLPRQRTEIRLRALPDDALVDQVREIIVTRVG